MKHRLAALATMALAATPLAVPAASAAEVHTVCTSGCAYSTIAAAVAASAAGDTVLVTGDLAVSGTTTINKDVTVQGTNGATVTQSASAITFLVTGSGATIEGLRITSAAPVAREFVQIGANDVTLANNDIYGPQQPLPMSGWVSNRGFVTQGNISGLLVTGNTISSVRSGAYLNPNGTGVIDDNVLFNTKGDFLIDRARYSFSGNRPGPSTQPSEWGFVIFAGTDTALYTDVVALSHANNGMSVWDQRDNEQYTGPSIASLRSLINGFVAAEELNARVAANLEDRLARAEVEAAAGSEVRTIAYLEQLVARAKNQIKGDDRDVEVREAVVREAEALIARYRALELEEQGGVATL
jgi:hypothetical protein